MSQPASAEKIKLVLDTLKKTNNNAAQASKLISIPETTVKDIRRKYQTTYQQAPTIASNKPDPNEPFQWRKWAEHCQTFQREKARVKHSQDEAVIRLGDGKSPVAVACFSDQHIGSWGCDYKLFTKFTDQFLSIPNLYLGLLGDLGQYSIKLRSVLEVSDNLLPPELQTRFIEDWLNEIQHKVAFATWDNHGVERQENLAGESSLKNNLAKRVVYFNGIGHVTLEIGTQYYYGAVSHCFRGRSINNPVHSQMRYLRYEAPDRDWVMAGDSHTPGVCSFTVGSQQKIAINSGALQTNSGYAKRYFSLYTHPIFPLIVFYPDRNLMVPFNSVHDWLLSQGKEIPIETD